MPVSPPAFGSAPPVPARRWPRRLLAAGVAVVLLAGAAHLAPVRARVLAAALGWVNGRLGLDARATRLDYNLASLRFTLYGVSIAARHAIDHPFFKADRVEVVLPWSWIAGRPGLEALRIDRPRFAIATDVRDRFNLPTIRSGAKSGATFTIRELALRDMTVSLDDAVRHVTLEVQQASLRLASDGRESIAGRLRMGAPGAFGIDGWHTTLTRLDARLGVRGGVLRLDPVTLGTSDGEISIQGTSGLSADAPLDLTVGAQLHLARIVKAFVPGLPVSGSVQVSGHVSGTVAEPHGSLGVRAPSVTWSTLQPAAVSGTLEVSRHDVQFTEVQLAAPWGRATLAGRLADRDAGLPNALDASWHAVDAASALNALDVDLPLRVGSAVDGTAAIRWTRREMTGPLVELTAAARPVAGSGLPVGGSARATRTGTAWTIDYDLSSPADVLARGRLRVDRGFDHTGLQGTGQVSSRDLGSALRALRGAGLDLPQEVVDAVRGSAGATVTFGGTTSAPRIAVSAASERLAYAPLPEGRADAQLTVEAHRVRIERASLQTDSAVVETHDLLIGTASGTVAGNVSAEARDLSPIARAVLPEIGAVSGTGTAAGRLTGSLAHPKLDLEVRGLGLAAGGQRLDRLEGRLTWAAPRIEWTDVRATQAGGGSLTTRGALDLQAEELDASVRGTGLEIAECLSAAPLCRGGIPLTARVKTLNADLRGPWRRPTGNVLFEADTVRWQAKETGTWSAHAAFVDGEATVDAKAAGLGLSLTGRIGVPAPSPFDLTLTASGADLSRLLRLADREAVAGRIDAALTATVHGTGDLAHIADAAFDATVPASTFVLDGRRWSTSGTARLVYGPDRIAVTDVSLGTGQSRLTAAGGLSRDGGETLTVAVDGALGELADMSEYPDTALSGQATARLAITGTPAAPRIAATATLAAGSVARAGWTLTIDEAAVRVEDGAVRLEHARLATTGAHATIDAVVPIALVADRLPERLVHAFGSPPVVPKATLSADVAWALDDSGLLTAGSVPVHGSVEGRVELESDRLEVNAIRGTGIVRAAELAVGTSRLTQAGEGRIAIADGRVTLAPWRLSGAGTDLVAEGSVVIGSDGDVPVAATVRGPIVLEPLQALLGIPISGVLTSDVRVGGTVSQPRLDGTLAVTGGALRIRTPRVALADVAGSVRLTGTSAVVDSVSGLVNGAPFTLDGAVALPGHPGAEPRSLRLRAERVPIQPFANGPRAEADLDLVYREKPGERLVTGSADLLPQPFRGSVLALKQFVDTVAAANAPLGETPRRKAGTSPVKLEIAVNSREPLLVDTNVGRVELAAKLTIAGSTDQPSLLGRVTILEDGVIRAGGRTYTISSGTIDFNNPRRVVPLINLTATTKISTYAITMVLAGTPEALQTSLTSDPPLAENDLRSLIVTGRLASQTGIRSNADEERQVVESISGDVFGFAAQAIGLDAVSIGSPDLDLLASDIDARTSLNLTKSLSRRVQVVYSLDLQEDRSSWLVIYRPTRALSFRVLSRDNREGAVEFRQEIRFGGPPSTAAAAAAPARPVKPPRITTIAFTGDRGVSDEQLLKELQLRAGKRFDTWEWRGETERLSRFYRQRGYYAARIVPRREADGDGMALEYAVSRGPRTTLAVDGHKMPPQVIEKMRDAWAESVSTAFLVEDLERVARTHLIDDGYLAPRVKTEVPVQTPATIGVVMHVAPGPLAASRRIDFAGASAETRETLETYTGTSGLARTAWYDPATLKAPIETFYRDRGYLEATVTPGTVQMTGTAASLPVTIAEGPLYRVARVKVDGADVLGADKVRAATAVAPETPWQSMFLRNARSRVEGAYHGAGFADTEVYVEPQVDHAAKRVTLYVAVAEGQRQVLQDLSIAGTYDTSTKTVSDLVNLKFGSPVTPALVSDVQKRLYDAGVFSRVLVDFTPAPGGSQATSIHDDPMIAKVTVLEAPRYAFQYGLQVSRTVQASSTESEYKPGASVDFRDRNFLGRALGLGVGVRADGRQQNGRMTVTMPRTYGTSIRSYLFLERKNETSIPEHGFEQFDDTSSITAEQRWRRNSRLELSWGLAYDYRRLSLEQVTDTRTRPLSVAGDTIGPRVAAVWDSRDNPFDSKRGRFHSFGFDLGLGPLGSDLSYTRFLVQNFLFVPKGPVVFASGLRYGSLNSWGSASSIELDLLFKAGGSRSVRGYAEDALSAVRVAGVPLGGQQVLVLNQEVRFPIWWWFKAAAFVDAGNTFLASQFRLADLKVGTGWGLRLASPLALIRFDVGYPVNDGSNHSPRYYVTIGQAF